jgi:hypothetical protein
MVKPPIKIKLNSKESKWYAHILTHNRENSEWLPIANQMDQLFKSLFKRNAIPKIRLDIFQDASLAEKRKKSILQHFQNNGISVQSVAQQPHFLKYLKYFIEGPDLPQNVIKRLCKIADEESWMDAVECNEVILKSVKACMREFGLNRQQAPSEFFRLANEIGFSLEDSKAIRKAAMGGK